MIKLAKQLKVICGVLYWICTMLQEIFNGLSALLGIYIGDEDKPKGKD